MLNELEKKIRKAIPELNNLKVVNGIFKPEPIQLNHVLEYVQIKHDYDFSQHIDRIILYILSLWNLKSNILSEQSDELIKFINEL